MTAPEERPEGDGGPGLGDDDWKEQARVEKERLAAESESDASQEIPPASFLGLLEEFSMRALFGLGQLPDPRTGQPHLDLGAARYTIDMLSVLEEKTRGNLDENEAAYLTDLVQRLRMAFVQISRQVAGAAAGAAGESAPDEPPPEEGAGPDEPKIII